MVGTRFLTIGVGVYKQVGGDRGEEGTRTIPMILGYILRHHYKLLFSLIWIQMDTYRNIYISVCTQVNTHTYIFLLGMLKGPRINEAPVRMNTNRGQILASILYSPTIGKE